MASPMTGDKLNQLLDEIENSLKLIENLDLAEGILMNTEREIGSALKHLGELLEENKFALEEHLSVSRNLEFKRRLSTLREHLLGHISKEDFDKLLPAPLKIATTKVTLQFECTILTVVQDENHLREKFEKKKGDLSGALNEKIKEKIAPEGITEISGIKVLTDF